ncbi:hypothetical protein J0A68_11615 [Algoriphagus sp. H41]|uniref:DUF1129 family protein n=1 Tax=Algoriphagus oliviformis TaxID=2811231 RepID=A0ABS3C3B4_9BACT|nr:hypothetical protein [Algoriphagus oliviformis]MBN7811602.1 hypothetical protein [Algoriphagus oliviformis]
MKKPNNTPLTPEQIAKIQSSLAFGSIFYEDIKAELVDHFATAIENDLGGEKSFESLLFEKLSQLDLTRFQRQFIFQAHLGAAKALFRKVSARLLFKVILITIVLGACVNVFSHTTPHFAETALKTAVMVVFLAIAAAGLFKARFLKNSQIVASGNTVFLIAILSQPVLRLEWLQWTGFSDQTLLYAFTFWFCLLLTAGYRLLSETVKKSQLA